MDADGALPLSVVLLRFAGVLAWVLALARQHRDPRVDRRPVLVMVLVATCLFASSAVYLGAPMVVSTTVLNLASVVILAGGLWVLWRAPA